MGVGSSIELRKALIECVGTEPWWKVAAHHLIPVKVAEVHREFLEMIGFRLDSAANGMFLPTEKVDDYLLDMARHAGNHRGYSGVMEGRISAIENKFNDEVELLSEGSQEYQDAVMRARQSIEELQVAARARLQKSQGSYLVAKGTPGDLSQDDLQKLWEGWLP